MANIFSFGGYTFPNPQTFSTNFGDLVTKTTRLPGVSGGFDAYGNRPAPQEIGRVNLTFSIVANTTTAMEAKLDAVRTLQNKGVTKLNFTPDTTTSPAPVRFCYARINNISAARAFNTGAGNYFQDVSIIFQVADPRWYQLLDDTFVLGVSEVGSGDTWGGSTDTAVTGSEEIAIATIGTAPTFPLLAVKCSGAQQVSVPRFSTIYNGIKTADLYYAGTIGNNEYLEINARTMSVKKNGVDDYGSLVIAKYRDNWLAFEPGATTLKVEFANASEAATVGVQYMEAFY